MEVKEVQAGYELWMSCLSRGIAVLQVVTDPVGIVRKPKPESDLFLTNYPNPVTAGTTLCFSLEQAGAIRLIIHDMTGRVVRDLADSRFASGTSRVDWNGLDNQGKRVVPGIYACRLTEEKQSRSVLIIVR
jgi:hypothetical protein